MYHDEVSQIGNENGKDSSDSGNPSDDDPELIVDMTSISLMSQMSLIDDQTKPVNKTVNVSNKTGEFQEASDGESDIPGDMSFISEHDSTKGQLEEHDQLNTDEYAQNQREPVCMENESVLREEGDNYTSNVSDNLYNDNCQTKADDITEDLVDNTTCEIESISISGCVLVDDESIVENKQDDPGEINKESAHTITSELSHEEEIKTITPTFDDDNGDTNIQMENESHTSEIEAKVSKDEEIPANLHSQDTDVTTMDDNDAVIINESNADEVSSGCASKDITDASAENSSSDYKPVACMEDDIVSQEKGEKTLLNAFFAECCRSQLRRIL